MLYISRKVGQSVVINNEIKVKIVSVHSNSIKMGFDSPTNASILREELHEKLISENIQALNTKNHLSLKRYFDSKEE